MTLEERSLENVACLIDTHEEIYYLGEFHSGIIYFRKPVGSDKFTIRCYRYPTGLELYHPEIDSILEEHGGRK